MGVAEVKQKVQRHLTREFGSISVDQDGDYWVTSGSARVYVSVKEWGERTFIEVFSQTNFGLAPSPELYEWIAKHTAEYRFGHVALVELDDGTARGRPHPRRGRADRSICRRWPARGQFYF